MRYPILSAGLLTTAAFVAFLATRPSAPDSITRSAPSSLAQALPAASSAPAAPLPALFATVPYRALPSESVQAVLPELAEAVSDWRAFSPDSVVFQLDDTLRVPFLVTEILRDSGRSVMTGKLDLPATGEHVLDGSFFVATAVSADRWDGVVILPGMEYRVTIRGGQASVARMADSVLACGADLAPQTATTSGTPGMSDARLAGNGSAVTVDVLFVYNAQALAERNNDRLAIDADASNYIAASNVVLANSRITTFTWRYLGAEPAPAYRTSESMLDDLRAMRGVGELTGFVDALQKERGADQVVLLAGGKKTDAVGWAWVGGNLGHSVVSYPFLTYSDGSRASTVTSFTTVAHELAHNFGCNHQRQDASTQARDGDGKYNYAHVVEGKNGPMGSIMAVYLNSANLTRVPYFSTAEVSYEGLPLGVGVNQPKAAMNALVLSENAARMAALQATPPLPEIVEHPKSATVTAGSPLAVSVTAKGEGLSYRWYRNGSALAGGEATLSLGAASAALAGEYHVEVSNRYGTTVSLPATISVTSTTAPAPSGSSTTSGTTAAPSTSQGSSGGGSGGGSTGLLSLLALGALVALRARVMGHR